MDENLKRKAEKLLNNNGDQFLAQLETGIETIDAVKEVSKNILELNENLTSKITEGQVAIEIENENFAEMISSVSFLNEEAKTEIVNKLEEIVQKDKEIQKVEIINHQFKDDPEIKTLLKKISEKELSVKAPIVNVDAPIVELNNEETNKILSKIEENTRQEEVEKVTLVDKDGKPVSLNVEPKVIVRDIRSMSATYTTRLDTASTSGVTYVGKAAIGTASSSPSWQIMKMDETGTPVTLITTWADGNDLFDNIWDNRTSLTYL